MYIKRIKKYAVIKLGYGAKKVNKLIDAFNCEKLLDSSNSGDYRYSSLATLGDSVASMLLCEQYCLTMRKGEITEKKEKMLSNKVFDKVSEELGLSKMCYSDGRTAEEQEPHSQLKNDPSAIFEAVLGAMYLDLGWKKLKKKWKNLFFPLIVKHQIKGTIETVESLTKDPIVPIKAANESEKEVVVFRPECWNSKVKNEVKKGQVYFDKSEKRGFDGQGIYFYKGTILSAVKEYENFVKKAPDSILVYKLALNDLPKANGKEIQFDTNWLKIGTSENCFCLITDKTSQNVYAEIKPIEIICLKTDNADEIKQIARNLNIITI